MKAELGEDAGEDGGYAALGVEEAGHQPREHPGQDGAEHGEIGVHAVQHQQHADRAAGRERAVHREVGYVKDAVGDVDADGHDDPDEPLSHGPGQGVQQRLQEIHNV